jgi:DNA helicase-2/ATP-dependent DNA helicase PcrA
VGWQYSVRIVLDTDQRRAAERPPQARQIVMAGPGSGKTHTVTALIRNLMDEHDVLPEEIVVISFSRAAVHAARSRAADGVEEGSLVEFRTLDSWASLIVSEYGDEHVPFTGYDARIKHATRLIASDVNVLEDVAHLVVDEMQDVVGLRAVLLLEILRAAAARDVGFSLFGDPVQALYDFQLSENAQLDTEQLLERVRGLGDVSEVTLSGSYRARHDSSRRALRAHRELLEAPKDQRYGIVVSACADLLQLGALEEALDVLRAWPGSAAFLTDTNVRAAAVRDFLRSHGVAAELRGPADRPSLRIELAELFENSPDRRLEPDQFQEQLHHLDERARRSLWLALREVGGSRGASVLEGRLASAIAAGQARPEFVRETSTQTVVSTVHRAKGLEFDNVVLVGPYEWLREFDDRSVAARVLFVALTRGRDLTCTAEGPDTRRWFRDAQTRRWFRHGPRRWQTLGTMLGQEDTRGLGFVPHDLNMHVGQEVTWSIVDDEADLPQWDAFVGGEVVARTSDEFGRDLARRLRRKPQIDGVTRWPGLAGGAVDGLETVVGPPRGRDGGSEWTMWRSTQVTGLLSFEWGAR